MSAHCIAPHLNVIGLLGSHGEIRLRWRMALFAATLGDGVDRVQNEYFPMFLFHVNESEAG